MGFSKKWSKHLNSSDLFQTKSCSVGCFMKHLPGNILANNHSGFQISPKEREIKIIDFKERN
jgi:hypothetical protein